MDLPNSAWSLQTAKTQGQREVLAKFWIAAPTDMLETLWNSPVGEATAELVKSLQNDGQLIAIEIQMRNQINEMLSQGGLQQPLATQLLLANFLFSPKERLRIQNPEQFFPTWFVSLYRNLYEESLSNTSSPNTTNLVPQQEINDQVEDLTKFPDTLQDLVSNRIQLNRMLGLSNLYYIDPEDKEITNELIELRISFAKAIQQCPENLLEGLWTNHLQDRYWSMVRCGIQKETLSEIDQNIKQEAVTKLSPAMGGGFDKPGSINSLLIAMLYFEPGSMTVNDSDKNIPMWLKENYEEVFKNKESSS